MQPHPPQRPCEEGTAAAAPWTRTPIEPFAADAAAFSSAVGSRAEVVASPFDSNLRDEFKSQPGLRRLTIRLRIECCHSF
jgi:hypothetical protein